MQFDKELILKHRFWIMLVLAPIFAISAILMLLTSVSGAISKERTKLLQAYNTLQKSPYDPANDTDLSNAREVLQRAITRQTEVWGKAYKDQADLYQWAPELEKQCEFAHGNFATHIQITKLEGTKRESDDKKDERMSGVLIQKTPHYIVIENRDKKKIRFNETKNLKIAGENVNGFVNLTPQNYGKGFQLTITYFKGHFFNDSLIPDEQRIFAETYKSQIHPLLEIVQPVDENGDGVVQLGDWLYDPKKFPQGEFLRYREAPWPPNEEINPQVWVAQEDLWIQKELYTCIRAANDSVSKLSGGETKPGLYKYSNPNFSLEFSWPPKNDELDVTISNQLKRRQKLDQKFIFHFENNVKTEAINIKGELLEPKGYPNDSRKDRISLKLGVAPKKVLGIEQQLNWETTAVKKLTRIDIGMESAHSHKNYVLPLIANNNGAEKPVVAAVPVEAPPDVGAPMKKGPGRRPGGGGPGAGGGPARVTQEIRFERYIDVQPQYRQIPVAVVMVVEQDHIDRILTAFGNSRLRFLTSQVIFNHDPRSLRPRIGLTKVDTTSGQDLESNVEMTIYGTMTIYERPARPILVVEPPKM